MLSKKDYIMIANGLISVMDYLETDNPKFDRERFIKYLKWFEPLWLFFFMLIDYYYYTI